MAETTEPVDGSSSFTPNDMRYMCAAFQSLKTGKPEVDYAKMATILKLGNHRSCSNYMAKLWKKIEAFSPTEGADTPTSTPKKGRAKKATGESVTPRKRKASELNTEEGDDDAATPTPTPKKKRGPPKKKKSEVTVFDEEEEKAKEKVKEEVDDEDTEDTVTV